MRGTRGVARIGHQRKKCATCNNFAQNVMRLTGKMLKDRHPVEYVEVRFLVELNLYPQVIEDFEHTRFVPGKPVYLDAAGMEIL